MYIYLHQDTSTIYAMYTPGLTFTWAKRITSSELDHQRDLARMVFVKYQQFVHIVFELLALKQGRIILAPQATLVNRCIRCTLTNLHFPPFKETLLSISEHLTQITIHFLTYKMMIPIMVTQFTWKIGTTFIHSYIPNQHWVDANGFCQVIDHLQLQQFS